jgi:hypothetical protein
MDWMATCPLWTVDSHCSDTTSSQVQKVALQNKVKLKQRILRMATAGTAEEINEEVQR